MGDRLAGVPGDGTGTFPSSPSNPRYPTLTRATAGGVVWHSVLQSQPQLHQDLDSPLVQAHLHIQLDQEGNPDRLGPRHRHRDMAGGHGVHRVRAFRGVLELVPALHHQCLLPAAECVVGKCGPPYCQ